MHMLSFFTAPNPFTITAPVAPEGKSFEESYTVTYVLAQDAQTEYFKKNEWAQFGYGRKEIYNRFSYDSYIKLNYKFEGLYLDAGYTQKITDDLIITKDTTVYVKVSKVQGTNGALLEALEALKMASFETIVKTDGVISEVAGYKLDAYATLTRFSYYSTSYEGYDKYWELLDFDKYGDVSGSAYAIKGNQKNNILQIWRQL